MPDRIMPVFEMEAREAIKASIDNAGYICLIQSRELSQDDVPEVIYLYPDQVPIVIDWLQQLYEAASQTEK